MTGENGTPDAPDWRYTPPVGIKGKARALPDGCRQCALSEVACDAAWHVTKEPCCPDCGHP